VREAARQPFPECDGCRTQKPRWEGAPLGGIFRGHCGRPPTNAILRRRQVAELGRGMLWKATQWNWGNSAIVIVLRLAARGGASADHAQPQEAHMVRR
jgi:hypothetical protein